MLGSCPLPANMPYTPEKLLPLLSFLPLAGGGSWLGPVPLPLSPCPPPGLAQQGLGEKAQVSAASIGPAPHCKQGRSMPKGRLRHIPRRLSKVCPLFLPFATEFMPAAPCTIGLYQEILQQVGVQISLLLPGQYPMAPLPQAQKIPLAHCARCGNGSSFPSPTAINLITLISAHNCRCDYC